MNDKTKLLVLILALVAVLAIVLVLVNLPGKAPAETPTDPATEPPTQAPTDPEPTDPEPTDPEPTEPEPTEPEPTEPPASISLNRDDFSFFRTGEKFKVYDGTIDASEVTFSSSNENVVTFIDGVATAVAPGMATITAEYEGEKVECYVHCLFENSEKVGFVNTGKYTLWTMYGFEDDHDITIHMSTGEYLDPYLKDAEGNKIAVEWTADKEGIVTIEDGKVTGVATGRTLISCTYEDQIIEFMLRVAR